MMGGIDQLVKQRMNIGRQNPQALQQPSSPMDPKLIELLALQKLKTEKEQAMQQLQLGQQTPPQTIAQQREQQVSDLTKKEVAQQIGGSMQQQEKQRQQQMMQMMGGAGIASVPRPPVNRMPPQGFANGGLVSFAGGGCVKGYAEGGSVKSEVVEAVKKYGPEKARQMYAGNPEALAVLDVVAPTGKPPSSAYGAGQVAKESANLIGAVVGNNPLLRAGDLGKKAWDVATGPTVRGGLADFFEGANLPVSDTLAGIGGLLDRGAGRNVADVARKLNNTAQAAPPAAPGAESLQEAPMPQRRSSIAAPGGPMTADPMTSGIMAPYNSDKAGTDLQGRQEQSYKKWMEPAQADLADMRAQRANIESVNAQQNDPRRLEMDRFKNFWLGMGNQSSNAGALRGAGIASTLTKDRQDQQARINAEKSYTMSSDLQTRSGDYGKGGFEAGVEGYKTGSSNKIQEDQNAIAAADVKQRGQDANTYRLEAQLNKTQAEAAQLAETVRTGLEEMKFSDPEMSKLQTELDDEMDVMWGKPDAAKIAEIKAKMSAIIQQRFAEELRLLEAMKAQEQALNAQLGRSTPTSSSMGSGGASTEGFTYRGEVR